MSCIVCGIFFLILFLVGCEDRLYLFDGRCLKSCPDGSFSMENTSDSRASSSQRRCFKCHYSCRICEVSFNNCTGCFSDADLHKNGRCYAKELVDEVIELERWYTAVSVVFLCLCVVILVLVVYIITDKNPSLLSACSSSSKPRRTFISLRPSHQLRQPSKDSGVDFHASNHFSQHHAVSTSVYRDDDHSEDDV